MVNVRRKVVVGQAPLDIMPHEGSTLSQSLWASIEVHLKALWDKKVARD